MDTKLATLRAAFAAGDHASVLRIAARFPRLGEHRDVIARAWAALTNPRFYRELGQDPDACVAAGIAAVRDRWELE
jgi:hypothetical protein